MISGQNQDRAWQAIAVILLLYVLSFAVFYPVAITNDDESMYLSQAHLLLHGRISVDQIDPLTGEAEEFTPSTYPVGTALLAAPFVAAAGWRGADVVPCLSLVAAILLCASWLREEGRSPLFALLLLCLPATLVMGRIVMGDVHRSRLRPSGCASGASAATRGHSRWR